MAHIIERLLSRLLLRVARWRHLSGFEDEFKRHWLGEHYWLPGMEGNDLRRTNVSNIRIQYRYIIFLLALPCPSEVPLPYKSLSRRLQGVCCSWAAPGAPGPAAGTGRVRTCICTCVCTCRYLGIAYMYVITDICNHGPPAGCFLVVRSLFSELTHGGKSWSTCVRS